MLTPLRTVTAAVALAAALASPQPARAVAQPDVCDGVRRLCTCVALLMISHASMSQTALPPDARLTRLAQVLYDTLIAHLDRQITDQDSRRIFAVMNEEMTKSDDGEAYMQSCVGLAACRTRVSGVDGPA